MKQKLAILSLLGMTLGADAAKIVWVSDNGDERATVDGNSVDGTFHPAVSAGTPYLDQGFVDLLIAAGHEVTRYNPDPQGFQDSTADIALLNDFDLIILGAALNSGPFNLASRSPRWNTLITKPMIVTKSTLIRRDRMGYLLDNKEYDCAADTSTTATGKLTFVVPAHPIFSGIGTTTVGADKVMNNFSNVIVATPANNRGTSVQFFNLLISGVDQSIANAMEPGGTALASIHFNPMDPGVNIPAGQAPAVEGSHVANGYAIAEWPAGTTVRTTLVTDGSEKLAGYRLFFGCGTRDASGSTTSAPNPQAGALDLSADGQQLFRNAVVHALSQPPAPNLWTNTSGDSLWNDASENWNSPRIWAGGSAYFGTTGAGLVTLGTPVTAAHVTFNAADYTVDAANGNTLTLAGTAPAITVNADATISASLQGTEGLTIKGAASLTLAGDVVSGLANQYTGGTFLRSGTVIMKALFNPAPPISGGNYNPPAIANGSYALDHIDALDAGATVRLFNEVDNLTTPGTPINVRVPNGQMNNRKRLIMTGGTLDIAGDDNLNNFPAPDGFGRITNSSPYARTALRMGSDAGVTHTFSGVISDGGPVTESVVPGKQGYRMDIDLQGFADSSATLVMAGLNTYTGFTRIGGGKLTFSGNGRWGVPTNTGVALTSSPAGTLITNGGIGDLRIDFNGTSQITGGLAGSGGILANNLEGTTSILTVGAADITSPGAAGTATAANAPWPASGGNPTQNGKIVDNTTGTGGVMALTKTGTGTVQLNTSQNTYSGPTTVNNGVLEFTAAGAPSPNSEIRINPPGKLGLLYDGTKVVKGLYLNGVKQAGGIYGATGSAAPVIGTSFITGVGTLTIVSPGEWTNASGDFAWNDTSANWSSPAVWAGGDAFFGTAGAGTVTITSPVTAHDLTVTGADYHFAASDLLNSLTLAGTAPAITTDAKVSIAANLEGTDGLTVRGPGTLTLAGLNTYTGGTFVKGGTLVLRAPTTGNNSSPYAVDGIDALDTGATVKFFNEVDLTVPETPANVRVPNGQIYRNSRLVLTGGTFDLAGDDNQNQMPAPSGTGRITNSSPYARAVLKMGAPGGSVATFSGIISDGGPLIESVVSGKQGYRMDIDLAAMGDDAAAFVMDGANTYTGFTRIGSGRLTFTAKGRWGVPTSTGVALTSSPNGSIICNGGINQLRVDFNGTSQVTGGLSGNGGVFANNAEGTVSTLTVGAANISNTVWPTGGSGQNGRIVDNTTGTGGMVALTKTGTGRIGLPTALNEYSGPTMINDGILEFTATGAPSPNSDIQINRPGQLSLLYDGTRNVNGLFINGVRQPANEYSAATHPEFITGNGTITVLPVHPTYPAKVEVAPAGSTAAILWSGVGLLQTSTDLENWTDLPGSISPYTIPTPAVPKVYYRIKQ